MPSPDVIARRVPLPEAQARVDESVAAWDGSEAEDKRREDVSGLTAARAEEEAVHAVWKAAQSDFIATEPRTMRGLLLKVRDLLAEHPPSFLRQWFANVDHDPEDRLAFAIVCDPGAPADAGAVS